MESVGIRELKTHLSRYLRRVRAGARLLVTERGRHIATISPIDRSPDLSWADQLVAEGHAHWTGGTPHGTRRPARNASKTKTTASSVVLEDRE